MMEKYYGSARTEARTEVHKTGSKGIPPFMVSGGDKVDNQRVLESGRYMIRVQLLL